MADKEKKRKVLFLVESLSGNSAENVLTTLVQYIDKTKYDVTVCAIQAGGRYESIIKENADYKAILSSDGLKHDLIYKRLPMSMVYKWFIPQGYDVEIAYTEGLPTKILSCSSNKKAKKYAWVHTDLHANHWTKETFKDIKEETKAYNSFDKVIGASESLCEVFKKEFPDVKTPVESIHNPIDSLAIRVKSFSTRQGEIPPATKPRLVTKGRLESQKGYMRLLKVIRKIVDTGYDLELWILGEGTERGILNRYIKENDLQNVVKLWGLQQNPYKYLAQGSFFVCSSLVEGYSTSVTEALILGLPIVTTDCRGLNELLQNGECALVTSNDERGLYDGIKKFLDTPELVEQYRQKSERRGMDFDIEALMVPIENLLAV